MTTMPYVNVVCYCITNNERLYQEDILCSNVYTLPALYQWCRANRYGKCAGRLSNGYRFIKRISQVIVQYTITLIEG